jgi:hypothetical protein
VQFIVLMISAHFLRAKISDGLTNVSSFADGPEHLGGDILQTLQRKTSRTKAALSDAGGVADPEIA